MKRSLRLEEFRAMGTICSVGVTAVPRDFTRAHNALAAAQREVVACERALSRFDAGSDLSRLNSANGSWIAVDPRLLNALAAALRARTETCGLFDPTILSALVAAGYDRSFERLTGRAPRPLDGWRNGAHIEVEPDAGRARIERGAAVDLGGIGKGFAASRAVAAMRAAWPAVSGAIVDLGGDIAVWGTPPEDGMWHIDIADPRAPGRTVGTLELESGGVASSGRDARRFGPHGELHHLIDPATGAPARAGPMSVTVVAVSATRAEVHATALAVLSVADARNYLASRPELSALLIPAVGDAVAIGRLPPARRRATVRLVSTPQKGFAWH
jgi:FAD:protein FMN transferase